MLGYKENSQATGQTPQSWIERYARRQQFRRMAKTLLAEKDVIIEDLGYERRDLVVAMSLPLHQDALTYLEQHQR